MLVLSLLQWWYSRGWLELIKRTQALISGIYLQFSVPTLLRTLFAPWKQIVAFQEPNQTIQMRMRGVLDTLVSRVVGFMVRSMTLVAAVVVMILIALSGLLTILIWPVLPLSVPLLMVKGFGIL